MYNLCDNIRSDYYLKARDVRVRLISCLPDSNRNSTEEFVRVSSNWLVDELLAQFCYVTVVDTEYFYLL